jgi:hypothetical protein
MSKKIFFNDNEVNDIIFQYTELKLSCSEIGKKYNTSKLPITNLLKELKLLRKGYSNGKKLLIDDSQKNYMIKLFSEDLKTSKEISEIMNLNVNFVCKFLKSLGYKRDKSLGTSIGMVKRFSGIPYDEFLKKLNEFKLYKKKVISITKKQSIHELPNFNKRGVSGIDGNYHLDHKFSIVEGFKQNINPEFIGNINNLEFIPWIDNIKKRTNCSINKKELKIQ